MSAKKILIILFGSLAVGVIALAALVVVFLPRYVEEQVARAANERGVRVEAGKVSFGLGWVRISDAQLALIGAPSLKLRVKVIQAELAGFTPTRVQMTEASASAGPDVAALVHELEAWAKAHGSKLREPLAVKPLSVRIAGGSGAPPSLSLEGGELRIEDERSELVAKQVVVLGRKLGELRARHGEQRARLDLTLGQSSLDNPLLAIGVDAPAASDRIVHVALSPVALGRLGEVLGLALPEPQVIASGSIGARWPADLGATGRIAGTSDVLLKGYVPPHPVELQGFVFGDTTTFSTRYVAELAALRVVLEGTRVKAGRFELTGGGEIRAEGAGARLSLVLSGSLPCNALASAMAESRLGRSLGKVTGKAARQVVDGSVGVRVRIDGTTEQLQAARVLRTITPGCGLKPLSLEELVKLGELFPEALDPKVAKDFEQLMHDNFPILRSLPRVPAALPSFELQLPPLPRLGSPPTARAPRGASSAASPSR